MNALQLIAELIKYPGEAEVNYPGKREGNFIEVTEVKYYDEPNSPGNGVIGIR